MKSNELSQSAGWRINFQRKKRIGGIAVGIRESVGRGSEIQGLPKERRKKPGMLACGQKVGYDIFRKKGQRVVLLSGKNIRERNKRMKIGMGYDVHRLTEGRPLILGGVTIPWEKGLLGHSDADVLVHAIMDALLGAAALGDIGRHFPDTDPEFEGISSILLLRKVRELLDEKGYEPGNIDATIIAQKPKMLPYIEEMRSHVADALGISRENVNIKATTEEGLGFTGSQEGISSHAVCLIYTKNREG